MIANWLSGTSLKTEYQWRQNDVIKISRSDGDLRQMKTFYESVNISKSSMHWMALINGFNILKIYSDLKELNKWWLLQEYLSVLLYMKNTAVIYILCIRLGSYNEDVFYIVQSCQRYGSEDFTTE